MSRIACHSLSAEVERWVLRSPDAPAVTECARTLSYGELWRRSGELARELAGASASPVVALALRRSEGFVVAALAVWRSGGAYAPIDPDLPAPRLRELLADLGSPRVVARERDRDVLAACGAEVLAIDSARTTAGSGSAPHAAGDLAYVVFTSGSTGRPKGVAVSHANLLHLARWHDRARELRPSDRVAQTAALGFDASVWEIWPALAAGACVVLAPEATRRSPLELLRWLERERIDVAFLPTATAEELIERPRPAGLRLRCLLTGGDRLRRRPHPSWEATVVNNYGPTENTVVATSGVVRCRDAYDAAPGIGRAIEGVRGHVLAPDLSPVPEGDVGELYLGGAGVARGYWRRPAETAAAFLPDPFAEEPGARMYRTPTSSRVASARPSAPAIRPDVRNGALDFSLFYFASDEGGSPAADKYELILESARFADDAGFAAVWTPERHFHAFGGLSPNPVVTAAALSVATKNVQLRSGSVVLPLHHPIRVAEEWALVDNLSGGRVGLGVASGWFPDDFVLDPDIYESRGELLFERTETLRRLWRGESLRLRNGKGDLVDVRTIPRPIQPELPIWITAAGNPETFRRAGDIGANVLTHLLGQSVEELAGKIEIYRQAWFEAGHSGNGIVSLMIHTFVGSCDDEVRETVREPMKRYLGSSVNLVQRYVDSFPIFKKPTDFNANDLTEEDLDVVLEYSFERYHRTSSLFGTVTTCLDTIERLRDIGVNDIACLVDFGVAADKVLSSLQHLDELRQQANVRKESSPESTSALVSASVTPTESDSISRVAEIWKDALQLETIELDQNFFDLGGHSLLAVRVLHAIEERFDRKLAVTDLFRFPTLRTLAEHLDGGIPAAPTDASRAHSRKAATRRRRGKMRRSSPVR